MLVVSAGTKLSHVPDLGFVQENEKKMRDPST